MQNLERVRGKPNRFLWTEYLLLMQPFSEGPVWPLLAHLSSVAPAGMVAEEVVSRRRNRQEAGIGGLRGI